MGHRNDNGDFLKAALLGGLVGGVAGLLLAPKSGKELRDDICEGYQCFSDKTHEFADDIKCKSKRFLHPFSHEEEEHFFNGQTSFITGGTLGAIIGATAALLLAPQSGARLREDLGEKYEEIRDKAEEFMEDINDKREHAMDQMEDWKDTFITLIEKLSSAKGRRGRNGSSRVNEILHWANIGLKLFQQLQSRR